jgi:hypothetical protein
MPPLRRDFGDCDRPVPGDPHRIESAASQAPIGPAIANEADERIDLGHRCRSEAI